MAANKGSVLLIVAWGLLGFFNAIALTLFLWVGASLKASSDDAVGLTFVVAPLAAFTRFVASAPVPIH